MNDPAAPEVVFPAWDVLASMQLGAVPWDGDKRAADCPHTLVPGALCDVRQLFGPHFTSVALKVKGAWRPWICKTG